MAFELLADMNYDCFVAAVATSFNGLIMHCSRVWIIKAEYCCYAVITQDDYMNFAASIWTIAASCVLVCEDFS
jgi:hypothetical protein